MWDRGIDAERALLGAVLLDPPRQHRVLDLVEPADMYRPWHAQVLAAMQRARARGTLPDPAEVYRELQNDPDLPRSVARDAVPLAGLMEAAPRASHAPAYAAIVIEGGIRQRLHLAGSRMVQTCDTGDLVAALRQAASAQRELDACQTRWLALPRPLRRELPGETGTMVVAEAGQRTGTRSARPRGDEALAAGVTALREFAAAPSQLARISKWLRPEHFARPSDGGLFAVMRDMDAAGMPVDPVTVTWEAARRGVQAEPGRLAGGMGAFAVSSVREVYRHGVLARVAQAGRDIQADATSPGRSPDRLMQTAGERLRMVEVRPLRSAGPGRAAGMRVPTQAVAARPSFREPEREAAR